MKTYLQKHKRGTYSDHWATPKNLYDLYINAGYLDPCPLNCTTDNLTVDFGPNKLFINPPYSDINNWVDYAIEHNKRYNKLVVMLVPARTDVKWFHKLIDYGVEVTFIKGRLKFNDGKTTAPFPSIYITILERKIQLEETEYDN